jgi:hypothetical protein
MLTKILRTVVVSSFVFVTSCMIAGEGKSFANSVPDCKYYVAAGEGGIGYIYVRQCGEKYSGLCLWLSDGTYLGGLWNKSSCDAAWIGLHL